MPLLHRRFPRYGRPLPFLTLGLAGLLLSWHGLNLDISASRQTGNFFLVFTIPTTLVTFEGGKGFLLIVGLATLAAALLLGTMGERALLRRLGRVEAAWWAPRFRFYPLTLLFGLFVLYFGVVFLFDASVAADESLGGFVAFVYLNYSGLLDRPFVSLVGLGLVALGLWAATKGAFTWGRALPRPAPPPTPAPASPPVRTPAPARPATPSPRVPATQVPRPPVPAVPRASGPK